MRAIGVEAIGIVKRFGSFTALDNVSLKVRAGTVHALLGENGAGKSTLVKCLLGYYRADDGSFLVEDREVEIGYPGDAGRLGLGMVYQHFTLVPSMTLAENLVMARADVPRIIDWAAEKRRLAEFLQAVPFKLATDVPVGALSAGERQKAEIVKQLYLERRFLVLDEPTSTLTPQEAEEVLGQIRGLVGQGALTVVVITHKLKEVAAFCDEVTVLRRGKVAGAGAVSSLSPAQLASLTIGEAHAPRPAQRRGVPETEPRLLIEGLRTQGDLGRAGLAIDRLCVRPREIVGVAGVSGNGQSELVEVLGGQRAAARGAVRISGQDYRGSRREAWTRGVRLLPEEPLRNGCVPSMSVIENLNLRTFDRDERGRRLSWLRPRRMTRRGRRLIEAFGIKAPAETAPISTLSGGNVQRAALARELDGSVEILVATNPCFGLDVKAVAEIRGRIVAARNAGTAVLLLSEDLDEILELSDRVVVMREGRIVHETAGGEADAQSVGRHMVGHA